MEEDQKTHSWLPAFMQNSKDKKGSSGEFIPDETTSLVPKTSSLAPTESDENGEVFDLEEDGEPESKYIFREFKILLKGSIPVILVYMLQNSLQTISVIIVGRRSPEDLTTAAFSYMFAMSYRLADSIRWNYCIEYALFCHFYREQKFPRSRSASSALFYRTRTLLYFRCNTMVLLEVRLQGIESRRSAFKR